MTPCTTLCELDRKRLKQGSTITQKKISMIIAKQPHKFSVRYLVHDLVRTCAYEAFFIYLYL